MNGNERIAYLNIKACFNYEVGGWYNCYQDNCLEFVPSTVEEAKEYLYDCAINNRYGSGYCGCNKAPKEMRFAGETFIRETIDKIWAKDEDIEELTEVMGW